jgi:hypothetical protein
VGISVPDTGLNSENSATSKVNDCVEACDGLFPQIDTNSAAMPKSLFFMIAPEKIIRIAVVVVAHSRGRRAPGVQRAVDQAAINVRYDLRRYANSGQRM